MKLPLHLKPAETLSDARAQDMMRLDLMLGMRALRSGNDGFRAPPSGKHHKGRKVNQTREERLANSAFS